MSNKAILTREKLLKSNVFWLEYMRNQMFIEVEDYLKRNSMSRKDLADKLGYSKGYISQILNGNSNLSFEKLTELAIGIGKVPYLYLKDIGAVIELENEGKSVFLDFEELERKADHCDILKQDINREEVFYKSVPGNEEFANAA